MAWNERRASWDYTDQEASRQVHGDYPQYEQRASRDYNRSYSDHQSEDSRDGRTYRQPPYGSSYEFSGSRRSRNRGSRSYPRNYGRNEGYYGSTAYPHDQEYNTHLPPEYTQPKQHYSKQPRESDEDHYSPTHDTRDQESQPYSPLESSHGREFIRQHRGSYPRFNSRDRGHQAQSIHSHSHRFSANPGSSPNRTEDPEFDSTSHENQRETEQSQNYPKSPLDRQRTEPYYPLSRLPKARSRCSSTSSGHSVSRDDCVICYGAVTHLAITPCEHSYCHLCCIRLLILCEDHHCPICRTPFEEDNPVILLPQPTSNPTYQDLVVCSRLCKDYGIALIPPLTKRFIDELFDLKCSVDECEFFVRNKAFHILEKHLKFVHEQYYCHVCLYGLKQFVFEMRLYSREELNQHKDGKGDSRLDPPGHKGHPVCRFCRERVIDESTLYEHLHKNHFWCYICERNGINMYYQNQEELRAHFKHEHFLCERGDCKNETFTSVFSSNIDLKAHISSVHAGDLKKNEAKNMRRVDIEFNYGHSAQQNTGDQGYRHRRQPRDRRGPDRRGNDRREEGSDENELNTDSFEPTTESNHTEYTFENENFENNSYQDRELPQNVDSNVGVYYDDEKKISKDLHTETEIVVPEPSIDHSTQNWPQVGKKKPITVSTNQKSTTDAPIHGPIDAAPSALLYSKSLGLAKQNMQPLPKPAKQPARVNQAAVPSPYSDALKPESLRAQKHQPQNQDSSEKDPSKQPPKQTYEDIFPALCATNHPVSLPQPDKLPQTQPSTTGFPHAKTGKKFNKQRKKDSKPTVTPSNMSASSLQSNSISDCLSTSKQLPKDKNTSQPAVNLTEKTNSKSKKQLSPYRSSKVNSKQQSDTNTTTQFEWAPPRNSKQRKSVLKDHIHTMSQHNPFILDYESKYQELLDKSCTVREFFQFCVNSFGLKFSTIFPEILVLIPDISLQQELLRVKEQLYPSAIFLTFASSSSSWSNQAHIQLETCPMCAQVLLPSDLLQHKTSHSTDNEFPALC